MPTRKQRDDAIAVGLGTGSLASLGAAEYARRGMRTSISQKEVPNRHGTNNRTVVEWHRWRNEGIPSSLVNPDNDMWTETSSRTDKQGWTRTRAKPSIRTKPEYIRTSLESPNHGYRKFVISSPTAAKAARARKVLPGVAGGLGAGALYFAARNRLRNAPIASEDDVAGRSRGYRSNPNDERRARHYERVWDLNRRY